MKKIKTKLIKILAAALLLMLILPGSGEPAFADNLVFGTDQGVYVMDPGGSICLIDDEHRYRRIPAS